MRGCIHSKKIIHLTYFKNIPILEFLIFLGPLVEKGDLQSVTEHRLVMSHLSHPWNFYI
jgi:hypothetical protein